MKYLLTIRRPIIIIFLTALFYALFYDFFLDDYLHNNCINKTTFLIFERIAFSLIATIIFFVINQHYPREKKKEKTLKQLKISISRLQIQTIDLLQSLDIECSFDNSLTQDFLDEKFQNRLTTEIIQAKGSTILKYPIYILITSVMKRMSNEIDDIVIFHDTIDNNILEKILFIKGLIDERKNDEYHEQIELPLTWESFRLASISKSLLEIRVQIFSKHERGIK